MNSLALAKDSVRDGYSKSSNSVFRHDNIFLKHYSHLSYKQTYYILVR